MAQWASAKEAIQLSLKVHKYCHLEDIDKHYIRSTFKFSLLGSTIYGRVMVDPVQNLGDSFSCGIEKVFLCTGADGYVPKYNPTNQEYGCLADSPSLLYRFKILVRCDNVLREPEMVGR